MKPKVLITGGAGFIGSHLVEALQHEYDVVVYDNLSTGKLNNLKGMKHHFIEGDIRDTSKVLYLLDGVDYVVHLAAFTSVTESFEKENECYHINLIGLLNVLDTAIKHKVKKFIFASSCAVYGDSMVEFKREELTNPSSPYADSKLRGEEFVNFRTTTQGVCLRFFNVFGPRQTHNYGAVIPSFIEKALSNKDLEIYGDGGQTRDFVYVKDVVRAIKFAIEDKVRGVFNVGYGDPVMIRELANRIVCLCGSNSKIKTLPERQGDIYNSCADVNVMYASGFAPSYNLSLGLRETIEYKLKELSKK